MTGSAREVLTKNWNRTFAISVERTLARAGFAIVPVEPTEARLDAARDWSIEKYGKPIGNDAARGCWKAMLSAARQQEGQDDG